MPRLILKCPYLKGSRGAARRGNYLRYIATREGVELIEVPHPSHSGGYLEYIAERPPGPTDCSPPIVPPTWRKLRMRSMGIPARCGPSSTP